MDNVLVGISGNDKSGEEAKKAEDQKNYQYYLKATMEYNKVRSIKKAPLITLKNNKHQIKHD